MKQLVEIMEAAEAALDNYNKEAEEHNRLVDILEARDSTIRALEWENAKLKRDADKAGRERELESIEALRVARQVEATVSRERDDFRRLKAELDELRKLDPKRLKKVNATQKKNIEDLKSRLIDSEQARKAAVAKAKQPAEPIVQNPDTDPYFYRDSVTGNTVRLEPTLAVGDDNSFGGVPDTPIAIFFHRDRGIARQGILQTTGKLAWASASNSTPTLDETRVARQMIVEFCRKYKIKLPKEAS